MDAFAFATLVGLICNFRQEKGAREALDHQKFIEWLEHHRHEDLKNLIVNQAALRTEVDNLLRSDMAQMLHKMNELSSIMVAMMGRLDEFKALAAVAAPKAELSDQAILILYTFAKSKSQTLYHADYGNGQWSLQGNNDETPMRVYEPGFIKDDLLQLGAMDFLDVEMNSQGALISRLTRNGSRFVQALGDTVKIPEDSPAE
jgi:hypothetical protein